MMAEDIASSNVLTTFHGVCRQVAELVDREARCDVAEEAILAGVLDLGRKFMAEFVRSLGDGDVGEQWEREGEVLKRQPEPKTKVLFSIFGKIEIPRVVYARRAKQKSHAPLDAQLGLPEGAHSYFLQKIMQRFCIKNPFDDAVESLKELFGLKIGKLTAEKGNQAFGAFIEAVRQEMALSPEFAEEDKEILVASVDGKGVPMRASLEETRGAPETAQQRHQRKKRLAKLKSRAKRRLSPGHGKKKKQMAWLSAVFTLSTTPRTLEDILGDLAGERDKTKLPKPVNKRIQACMTDYVEGECISGQDEIFRQLVEQIRQRDPDGKKILVCLMDGQTSLWARQQKHLPNAVPILDLPHVIERLWKTAYCFHPKTSAQAEAFVEKYLRMLLEGRVDSVIRSLRAKAKHCKTKDGKETLRKVSNFFQNNRERMKYDEYLAKGFPIASGVIEGTCRHLVNDRMERTGMKWTIDGAKAMLNTRSTYINGDWDELFERYVKSEQDRLYAQAA